MDKYLHACRGVSGSRHKWRLYKWVTYLKKRGARTNKPSEMPKFQLWAG